MLNQRSGNPAMRAFADVHEEAGEGVMTLQGVAARALLLLALVIAGAAYSWLKTAPSLTGVEMVGTRVVSPLHTNVQAYLALGGIGGFVLALVTCFVPRIAAWTSPIYAFLEGIVLGSLSAIFQKAYPGIAVGAMTMTVGVFVAMLLIYRFRILRATENFTIGVIAATCGICICYLIAIVMRFFGMDLPFIHETGWAGILFSLAVVTIAALNLVLDFDLIERGCNQGAPKYMEWYGAFALMVTLIWLYLEILRLLAKMRGKK